MENLTINPEEEDDGSEEQGDEAWDESQEGDEEEDATVSLFESTVLPSTEAAFKHDQNQHGFELRAFAAQHRLDDYGIIRCVNFIRSEVAAGRDPRPMLHSISDQAPAWLSNDSYLRPVLQDDPLLFYDYDTDSAMDVSYEGQADAQHASGSSVPAAAAVAGSSHPTSDALAALSAELAACRLENSQLRIAMAELTEIFMPTELQKDRDAARAAADPNRASTSSAAAGSQPAAAAPSSSAPSSSASKPAARVVSDKAAKVDEAYFDSYGGFDIHREMISDKPRTEAYRQALECNPDLIKGKVVMDVGCGSGILSLFAARAGASQVVAVDGSGRIAGYAKKIAALNGQAASSGNPSGPISVVVGMLEELKDKDFPVTKVDVIVSEWMGYALFFESMLDTVLHARDRFLNPGGAILPDIASVYIAGAKPSALGLDFWQDVYGFSMTPIKDTIYSSALTKGCVLGVSQEDIITQSAMVKELDLCTMTPGDQEFTAAFTLTALPSVSTPTLCSNIVLWFDTAFSARHCTAHPVMLSTSPAGPMTHWAQTVLTLRTPVLLLAQASATAGGAATASVLTGRISMVRAKGAHRSLDISLEYTALLSSGSTVSEAQLYHMGMMADN